MDEMNALVERRVELARVAKIHDDWVTKQLEADPSFDTDRAADSGDYNVWHVDANASAKSETEFMKAATGETPAIANDDEE